MLQTFSCLGPYPAAEISQNFKFLIRIVGKTTSRYSEIQAADAQTLQLAPQTSLQLFSGSLSSAGGDSLYR